MVGEPEAHLYVVSPPPAARSGARLPSPMPSCDRHGHGLHAAGSAGAYRGSQADRTGGVAMPSEPTLLRVLITRRHWQKFETFESQFKRAARELAGQDDEPRLRTVTVSPRQFERWYAYPVQQLLAPAPNTTQQLTPDGRSAHQHQFSGGMLPVRGALELVPLQATFALSSNGTSAAWLPVELLRTSGTPTGSQLWLHAPSDRISHTPICPRGRLDRRSRIRSTRRCLSCTRCSNSLVRTSITTSSSPASS